MENKICIIPARGGSKRIPRKNIKDFFGKPIIAYAIEAATNSGLFDEIMVSTDDTEIAEIARQYGANIPFMRSERNSDDFATTADVLMEVLEKYAESGVHFISACCIYPAAPLITAAKLNEAFDILKSKEAFSIVPVSAFDFPIWRSLKIENEKIKFIWPENALKRSQDLVPAYHDCGQFYVFQVDCFLKERKLFTERSYPLLMSGAEVQDIDNENDWQMAELKYKILINSNGKL